MAPASPVLPSALNRKAGLVSWALRTWSPFLHRLGCHPALLQGLRSSPRPPADPPTPGCSGVAWTMLAGSSLLSRWPKSRTLVGRISCASQAKAPLSRPTQGWGLLTRGRREACREGDVIGVPIPALLRPSSKEASQRKDQDISEDFGEQSGDPLPRQSTPLPSAGVGIRKKLPLMCLLRSAGMLPGLCGQDSEAHSKREGKTVLVTWWPCLHDVEWGLAVCRPRICHP